MLRLKRHVRALPGIESQRNTTALRRASASSQGRARGVGHGGEEASLHVRWQAYIDTERCGWVIERVFRSRSRSAEGNGANVRCDAPDGYTRERVICVGRGKAGRDVAVVQAAVGGSGGQVWIQEMGMLVVLETG